MLAPAVMIQGTASSVGKSILTTALCRIFRQEGLRVIPFKSQNMALNSAVTADGGEIGRAQAVQAEAAGVAASVEMNPILLKPEGDARSQVVVLGKPIGSFSAAEYHAKKPELRGIVAGCLERLRRRCDLLVIEGAGSPAEINLRDRDIVNMHVAKAADAKVLLVGDIDRGGVFAAFVGTMELLEPDERALVAGYVINKFRGDVRLLQPGLDFLTARTGVPVAGVVPHVASLRIADEDSVSLDDRSRRRRAGRDEIEIAVVRLPRISNYDDFEPLEHEPGVVVRFVEYASDLDGADLVILPGSKSTVADLGWVRDRGMDATLRGRAGRGEPVLGICGGCQMLGEVIEDPDGVESKEPKTAGLGLLTLRTTFRREKVTAQVAAGAATPSFLTDFAALSGELAAYEIHMGEVAALGKARPAFTVRGANRECLDGGVSADGQIVGTLLHGLFANDPLRTRLLAALRKRKGLPPVLPLEPVSRQAAYDRLAAVVREHLDMALVRRIAGLSATAAG
jgi:adenosylcobyric acid synthase